MEKITIHRALAELKLIGNRIEKGIEEVIPTGIVQKGKLVNGHTKQEDFEQNAKTRYQSVIDLIDRRNKIKSAIVKANGETTMKIAGEEMTIADAINFKASIQYQKKLVEATKKKHKATLAQLEKNNATIDLNAIEFAKVALGKKEVKINDTDVQSVIAPYLDNNSFSLVDSMGFEKVIKVLEDKIESFEAEVDAALSEINAITFIEI